MYSVTSFDHARRTVFGTNVEIDMNPALHELDVLAGIALAIIAFIAGRYLLNHFEKRGGDPSVH